MDRATRFLWDMQCGRKDRKLFKNAMRLLCHAIGQQRQIACVLDDVTQEAHGIFKQLAVFTSTLHVPQKTCRPIHQHNRPSL